MPPFGLAWLLAVMGLGLVIYWRYPAGMRPWILAILGLVGLGPLAPGAVLGTAGLSLALAWGLRGTVSRRRAWVAGAALLALLVGFKAALEIRAGALLLPLGLSFVTFRLLHFVIARRTGSLGPQPMGEVLGWILFPPLFSAGPIERLDHQQQRREDQWRPALLVEGGGRILSGLVKKLVLADGLVAQAQVALGADAEATLGGLQDFSLGVGAAWIFAGLSLLHLYLDFSGYSDLAIGGGRLFGLRVTENFRWPMFSNSPADFWRRWHISLADWCRDTLYMPLLGGSRSPVLAVLVTFVAMGLWHALRLDWLLWGLWHGAALAAVAMWRRRFRKRRPGPAIFNLVTIPATLGFVTLGHALTALQAAGGTWGGPALLLRMVGLFLPWGLE